MFTLCITHWRFRSQFCLCNGDFGNQSPVPVTLCILLVSASLLLSTGPRNSRLFVQDGHRQAAMLKNERQVTIGAVTLGKARSVHFRFLESDQARCENYGFQTHVWQKMERPRRVGEQPHKNAASGRLVYTKGSICCRLSDHQTPAVCIVPSR